MPVHSVTTTIAAVSVSNWIPLNQFQTPFNVGFGVVVFGTGDITFSVQHTFDDVFDSDVTPTAFTHADVTAATASIDGNYAYPVGAVRLNVASVSGTVGGVLTVRQSGF